MRTKRRVRHNVKRFVVKMSRDMTNPTKWVCAQRRLRLTWASAQSDQSLRSLSAWRKLGSLHVATHWAHSEDSDQTGRMPRLIWIFAGHTLILLVLSCRGSNHKAAQITSSTTMNQDQAIASDPNPLIEALSWDRSWSWAWGPNRPRAIKEKTITINHNSVNN